MAQTGGPSTPIATAKNPTAIAADDDFFFADDDGLVGSTTPAGAAPCS